MSLRLELEGLPLVEAPDRQLTYTFTVFADPPLDEGHRHELDGLVSAWYRVGFYGGYGGGMNQTATKLSFGRKGAEETFTFWVVGAVTRLAIDVLLRCLEEPDLDLFPSRVRLKVSEYRG